LTGLVVSAYDFFFHMQAWLLGLDEVTGLYVGFFSAVGRKLNRQTSMLHAQLKVSILFCRRHAG
jgi:hypothetical protein